MRQPNAARAAGAESRHAAAAASPAESRKRRRRGGGGTSTSSSRPAEAEDPLATPATKEAGAGASAPAVPAPNPPAAPSSNWKALLPRPPHSEAHPAAAVARSSKKPKRSDPAGVARTTHRLGEFARERERVTGSERVFAETRAGGPPDDTAKLDPAALWFDDISNEDLELAYGPGAVARDLAPLAETAAVVPQAATIGNYVAIDCEMVGVGPNGSESALARVSIVNFNGAVILDKFVKPREAVTDYRTPDVAGVIRGRTVVGHSLRHDFDALLLDHPRTHIRDTAACSKYRRLVKTKTPALKRLAELVLNERIQTGSHSSVCWTGRLRPAVPVEDARIAMRLYKAVRTEWEAELKDRATKNAAAAKKPGRSHEAVESRKALDFGRSAKRGEVDETSRGFRERGAASETATSMNVYTSEGPAVIVNAAAAAAVEA
ncbi:MAG: ribonuclease H-like domain-containing protein [Olpidium bornovanus]|uniref:RNA exonuclease 4 n=1 Tax=Olpidium bornovanus TaxID=278681 RepID=A0A8H8A2H7_9FUNG|nr:MAG: ribonuclease H-like domain-containing protein [Olpidium bornovanus]